MKSNLTIRCTRMAPLVALASVAFCGVASAEEPSPVYARYQPTIDITQDPGCGKKLQTRQEKIDHNRKLAELWFVNYLEAPGRKRNYNWWTHDCIAKGATFLFGTIDPDGTPFALPARPPSESIPLSDEQLGYDDVFPGFGSVPGSFMVYPNDSGGTFHLTYGGKDRQGNYHSVWEQIIFLTDDEGRVTHISMWDDTAAMSKLHEMVFGVPTDGMTLADYLKSEADYVAKRGLRK